MRNFLGLLCAEDANRMNARMHEFGERDDASSVMKILGKCECNWCYTHLSNFQPSRLANHSAK